MATREDQETALSSVCVNVVLPAAGTGERMNHGTPKQFIDILGRPLISYTIESFQRIPWISKIFVVVNESKRTEMERLIQRYGHHQVVVCTGKETRHRSIKEGVINVFKGRSPVPNSIVIIQDAVRPFIEKISLGKLVIAAKNYGAAGLTRPLVSTVLSVTEAGFLQQSLDRSKYVASEMPQAFRYDVIMGAYEKCDSHDLDFGTECLHLAQKYSGVTPKLIEGTDCLWKVTYKKDIYAAEGVIKEELQCVSFITKIEKNQGSIFAEHFKNYLRNKNIDVNIMLLDELTSATSSEELNLKSSAIVCYSTEVMTSEEIDSVTFDIVKTRGNNLCFSGVILHVFDLLHLKVKESSPVINHIQDCVRCIEEKIPFQETDICINALILSRSDKMKRSNEMVWNILFNKNKVYSGQTFIL